MKYEALKIASSDLYAIAEVETGRMLAVKVKKDDAELIVDALNGPDENHPCRGCERSVIKVSHKVVECTLGHKLKKCKDYSMWP